MRSPAVAAQPLTAVVRRRVKAGSEGAFEALMREFTTFVLGQPGNLGINILRPSPGSRDYTVLDRFATREDRRKFTDSSEYREWMGRFRDVSEGEHEIEEMEGLAFWFTLPGRPTRKPPPRIKMAVLTLVGVYPLSVFYPMLVLSVTPAWPHWVRAGLTSALFVVSLTWFIMPALTRLFEEWLFPSDERQ